MALCAGAAPWADAPATRVLLSVLTDTHPYLQHHVDGSIPRPTALPQSRNPKARSLRLCQYSSLLAECLGRKARERAHHLHAPAPAICSGPLPASRATRPASARLVHLLSARPSADWFYDPSEHPVQPPGSDTRHLPLTNI